MIAKTTEALALSYNLGAKGGKRRFIGTRYHFADTYATIIERGTATPRIHPATVDGTVLGEPVMMSREALAEKRRDMGAAVFACQMLQNPLAAGTFSFNPDWLKHWAATSTAGLNLYLLCDPAHSKKKGSDYSAFFIVGLGSDLNYYIIDLIRDRLNLGERTETLMFLHRKYRPIATGYERYGLQSDIEHIEMEMSRENYRFTIEELGGKTSKLDRIGRLIPKFEAGRVYLPTYRMYRDAEGKNVDLVQSFIQQEYMNWPVSAHDDMLDCLARIDDIGAVFPAPIYTGSDVYIPDEEAAY
jgi:predicted phage terminase large subunit-like protein